MCAYSCLDFVVSLLSICFKSTMKDKHNLHQMAPLPQMFLPEFRGQLWGALIRRDCKHFIVSIGGNPWKSNPERICAISTQTDSKSHWCPTTSKWVSDSRIADNVGSQWLHEVKFLDTFPPVAALLYLASHLSELPDLSKVLIFLVCSFDLLAVFVL